MIFVFNTLSMAHFSDDSLRMRRKCSCNSLFAHLLLNERLDGLVISAQFHQIATVLQLLEHRLCKPALAVPLLGAPTLYVLTARIVQVLQLAQHGLARLPLLLQPAVRAQLLVGLEYFLYQSARMVFNCTKPYANWIVSVLFRMLSNNCCLSRRCRSLTLCICASSSTCS